VRRARSVRDHRVARLQRLVVYAVDDRGVDVLAAGRRDDHLLRAGFQMHAGLLLRREQARALEHDVDAERAPRQLRRIAFGADFDLVAGYHEMIAFDADLERKTAVRGVVTREMRVRLRIAEIVDGDDLNFVRALALVQRAQDVAADTAITVDSDFDGHDASLGRQNDWTKAGAARRRGRLRP